MGFLFVHVCVSILILWTIRTGRPKTNHPSTHRRSIKNRSRTKTTYWLAFMRSYLMGFVFLLFQSINFTANITMKWCKYPNKCFRWGSSGLILHFCRLFYFYFSVAAATRKTGYTDIAHKARIATTTTNHRIVRYLLSIIYWIWWAWNWIDSSDNETKIKSQYELSCE